MGISLHIFPNEEVNYRKFGIIQKSWKKRLNQSGGHFQSDPSVPFNRAYKGARSIGCSIESQGHSN